MKTYNLLHLVKASSVVWAAALVAATFAACSSPAATSVPVATPTSAQRQTPAPTAPAAGSTPPGTAAAVNPCPQEGVKDLTGAGSSFAAPLYGAMFDAYNKLCGVRVNYQSIGSGGGINALQHRTVDFAGSDAVMTDPQKAQAEGGPVLHIPTAAGAVAVMYNLPGIERGQIKLAPDVLADIYLKKIANWNDPRIVALNPGVKLPNLDIAVVHRSDGSGTSFIFTNYLSKVSPEWQQKVGSATSVSWPGDVGAAGSEGVTNQVRQLPGAIGYVELAYAVRNNVPWALLRNRAGSFIEPSLDSATLAADVPNLPDNMEVVITDSENPGAYPIVGFTWLLVYSSQSDAAGGDVAARLAWWMLHDGQRFTTPLNYVPVKGPALAKAENLIKSIKVGGQPVLR